MNDIQALITVMGTKMVPTYDTLTWAYLEENLYEIIWKNTTIWKQNLFDHGKDSKMTVSYHGNCSLGNINDLHNLLQNSKIKSTIEYSLKEQSFFDILIIN